MHRNTYLLVIVLAIFAALVVGVNIGKRVADPAPTQPVPSPSVTVLATPSASPNTYKNPVCGISLTYPSTLNLMDSASGSALFIDKEQTSQSVVITCQKDIPRPALSASNIESLTISNESGSASVSAKLYHDASAKDSTPIDELIFRHPKTGLDVYIAGFGETFNALISTVKLFP